MAAADDRASGDRASNGGWVVSPSLDLVCFGGPVVAAFAIALFTKSVPADAIPFHWWLGMGVLIDVAHVYGTLYRTIFDSEATSRNWALYIVAGPVLLGLTLFVNLVFGTQVGWTLLAYYAMFHFAKQPFGILCLYKARRGERCPTEHQWDYWTCMAGAAIPTLINHAGGLKDHLGWFNAEEDFAFRLPQWAATPLYVLYAAVPAAWALRLAKRKLVDGLSVNVGKVAIMAIQYTTWWFGSSKHQLTALAFHNLFHGVASMLLVHHVTQRRLTHWRKASPSTMSWRDRLNDALISSPWKYMLLMGVFGGIEEFGWEYYVNQDYLWQYGYKLPNLSETQYAVATSILMWPQLSHYFLDGFIWRLTTQNPGLREALLEDRALAHTEGASKKED